MTLMAFKQTPTPDEFRPILPMRPASVIILIVGLLRAGWWIVRAMRLGFWADIQSQFWARRLFELLAGFQERAVQPSLKRPKAISVRTFGAMMSGRGTSAPRAMPGVGALGLALVWRVVDVFAVVVLVPTFHFLKIRRPVLADRRLEHHG